MSRTQSNSLLSSLQKTYEQRSKSQQHLLISAIAPLFPTLSPNKIAFITFYMELCHSNQTATKKLTKNSFIFIFSNGGNPESPVHLHILKQKQIVFERGDVVAILNIEKYLNIMNLGQTTVQQELNFWSSSQYFCSMPKKKLFKLLRSAQVFHFIESQCVYVQGQLITQQQSGSGVYVVRKGQFGYYNNMKNREIETSRFVEGHIFGVLEILKNSNEMERLRVMSAKCKSSRGLVYHFNEQFFSDNIKHYNQHIILKKQAKLFKFIHPNNQESHNKTNTNLSSHSLFSKKQSSLFNKESQLSKAQRKVFPAIRLEEIKRTASISLYNRPTNQLMQNIKTNEFNQTTSSQLKNNGPLKYYPMISNTANFTQSQFKDLDKILFQNNRSPEVKERTLGTTQNGVWKRDVIYTLYRQNLYTNRSHKRAQSNNIPNAF